MKKPFILMAGAMIAAISIGELAIQPALAQNGPQNQYQDDRGIRARFDDVYRQGYRAGYTAARHNQHYDDRRYDDRHDDHRDGRDNRDYRDQQR
ncbi:MAG: hypothetical protein H0U98_11035 [Alphaproteobacteria bacterium]|nr:hypothetical protein [Alphaproteobacteria bacterium]